MVAQSLPGEWEMSSDQRSDRHFPKSTHAAVRCSVVPSAASTVMGLRVAGLLGAILHLCSPQEGLLQIVCFLVGSLSSYSVRSAVLDVADNNAVSIIFPAWDCAVGVGEVFTS